MTSRATQHLKIFQPHDGVFAYYDGRVPGHRFMQEENWVDSGAIALGIATYALVAGDNAIVYDTHVSLEHAAAIRTHLESLGVREFTIVYSHWHLDHVAGTAAFGDCTVIANARTARHLSSRRDAIEAGQYHGPPAIDPLVLPTKDFSGQMRLQLGDRSVDLIEANIHSDDATVLWLPEDRILLAGDTIEDPLTFVAEPENFSLHLRDLDRLAALKPRFILPDHGALQTLEKGGFGPEVIPAMQRYIRWLMALKTAPERAAVAPQEILADELEAGTLIWYEPYADVHAENVAVTLKLFDHV